MHAQANASRWKSLPRSPGHGIVRVRLEPALDGTVEIIEGSEALEVQRGLIDLLVNPLNFRDAFAIAPD